MREDFPRNDEKIARETASPRLKEYPKTFGQDELENMIDGFMLRELPGIKDVVPVSRYDDQRIHVDRLIETESGVRFIPDYTSTTDRERMERKTRQFLDQPLVRIHDNRGRVVDAAEILRLVIPVDKLTWGRAYNRFLEAGRGLPFDYLPDTDREALKIAERVVGQIDQLLESMKESGKSVSLISRVADKSLPVRRYFEEQAAFLKKKKASRHAGLRA